MKEFDPILHLSERERQFSIGVNRFNKAVAHAKDHGMSHDFVTDHVGEIAPIPMDHQWLVVGQFESFA